MVPSRKCVQKEFALGPIKLAHIYQIITLFFFKKENSHTSHPLVDWGANFNPSAHPAMSTLPKRQ
jgi:hypothetical protein